MRDWALTLWKLKNVYVMRPKPRATPDLFSLIHFCAPRGMKIEISGRTGKVLNSPGPC